MELKEYIKNVKRTESGLNPLTHNVTALGLTDRMLHAAIGVSGEVGEIAEAYQRTNIDYINVIEEIGDSSYYLALLLDEFNIKHIEVTEGPIVDLITFPKVLVVRSAELLDLTKKTMFYGKELNQAEFLGVAKSIYKLLVMSLRGLPKEYSITIEEVMQLNIDKLKVRYPRKFTSEHAEVRNLDAERKILEGVASEPT